MNQLHKRDAKKQGNAQLLNSQGDTQRNKAQTGSLWLKPVVNTNTIFLCLTVFVAVALLMMNLFEQSYINLFSFDRAGNYIVSIGGGFFVSWAMFGILNLVAKIWGERQSKKMLILSCVAALAFSLLGMAIAHIPMDTDGDGIKTALENPLYFVLGFRNLRVILASIFAFLMSGSVNIFVISKLIARRDSQNKGTGKWAVFAVFCVITSLFAQFTDNMLFGILGTWAPGVGGGMAINPSQVDYGTVWGGWYSLKQIFAMQSFGILLEVCISAITSPVIALAAAKIQKIKERE